MQLSSQKARLSASELLTLTLDCEGFLVPAHVFTPHKGFYGACCHTLSEAFTEVELRAIPAIELGLSADSSMASRLDELDGKSFLSNSDAHSLPKIAREYNRIAAVNLDFRGLRRALQMEVGGVVTNYGLDPRLGKYHRTSCEHCKEQVSLRPDRTCPKCGRKVTVGVADRLDEVADRSVDEERPRRPLYVHQIPLEFVPGVGPRTLDRLLEAFGTEMNVLHRVTEEALAAVVPQKVARRILLAREGRLQLVAGGGGVYGRVR